MEKVESLEQRQAALGLLFRAGGIREVEDGRWLVSFMDLDLGYVDERTRVFEPLVS